MTEKSVFVCDDGLICSYCEQGLGSYHKKDCDHICKDVKIRAAIEYTINVPGIWSEDEIKTYASTGDRRSNFFDKRKLESSEVGKLYFNGNISSDNDVFCSWCASWRGISRREDCDHICKDVKNRSCCRIHDNGTKHLER